MIKAKILGDKTLLFGLNWGQTSKENLASKIKSESDRVAMDYGISRHYKTPDGEVLYQYSLSDYDESLGAYSAADILSSLQEDVLFIYSINADECWLCVIHNGEVVSGGDVVVAKESFSEEYQRITTEMEIDISQFKVYADKSAVKFSKGIYEAEIDFDEVISQIDFSDYKSFYKVRKNLQKIILAGIGLAFLAGAVYVASSIKDEEVVMQKQPRPSIEDMRLKIPDKKSRNVGDIVNQKVGPSKTQIMEDAYREELSWLNFDFNLNDDAKLLMEISKFLRTQNINEGGWVANNYYYDISAPNHHELVWSKRIYGTALTLKNSLESKGISQLQFNENGTRVSSFVQISNTKPSSERSILKVMNETKQDLFHFMHDLDVKKFNWSSELTPVSERPVPISGVKNMIEAKKRQLNIKSRDFRISGSGINSIEKLSWLLESHDRFVIQRLSFDFKQNFNWIVYGVFYEKENR